MIRLGLLLLLAAGACTTGDVLDGTDAGGVERADAGGVDGTDAGDGDGDACAPAADPDLGSLTLGSGFNKVEAAVVDLTGIVAVVVELTAVANRLYALSAKGDLTSWSGWPNLSVDSEVNWSILRAGEDASVVFASSFLLTRVHPDFGPTLIAGYTGAFDPVTNVSSGTITRLDPQSPTTPDFFDAPNIFSAAVVGDLLFANGGGVEAADAGTALYALDLIDGSSSNVVTFPADAAGNGFTTAVGDLIVAGFADADFANQLFVTGFTALADATTNGALDATTLTTINTNNVQATGSMLDRLVILQGTFDANFNQVQTGLVAYALSTGPVIGAEEALLNFPSNGCESIRFLASMDSDLLVGLTLEDGSGRIVRIAAN